VLHPGKTILLGAGTVIHLPTLLEEIRTLQKHDIDVLPRLYLSPAAHIVLQAHQTVDAATEESRGSGAIGTTKRGIGPAYADKARRIGLRLESLAGSQKELRQAIESYAVAAKRFEGLTVDIDQELAPILEAQKKLADRLLPDMPGFLAGQLHEGKRLLIEGAQATLLDIDHGTYPFVTSSATTAAGALQGIGLAPRRLQSCIGVAKAYCTRVGGGPFPSEADEERQDLLRERGGEYGATTGRPRRCGWLSLPDLRSAATLNGFTHWNITKLDVLDVMPVIPVMTGLNGNQPVLEELPGWENQTAGAVSWEKLPANAQTYLEKIQTDTGVPVSFIGTGPGRDELIIRS
jgi:adenylosuccinate synthase